jgi:acyl-CoA synthetase (AMP-forming)/AMP-acid ligase II
VTIQHPSAFAETAPDRTALVVAPGGATRTYAELEARSNQVAHLLRCNGLGVGDTIAVLLENQAEFFEVSVGAMRMGLLVTPINWHLAPDEAAYIIRDSEASALVASATLAPVLEHLVASGDASSLAVRLVTGGAVEGFDDYEHAVAAQPTTPVEDQFEGSWMLYSSGTTGRPKGIKPGAVGGELGAPTGFSALVAGLYGFGEGNVYLSPAPLYHAAPAGWTNAVHRLGGTVVVMDRFDPLATLALIEEHRVTHVQFVPTHLVRLLKLPEAERARFDLSSLQCVVHAAAPCPPEVKRAALDWLGPIVHEYYSGSEGAGFCAIGPDEWLAHPGSVGKSLLGTAHVTDANGTELGPDEVGQIWFESGQSFSYHGDAEKTSGAHDERGWSTLGDMGYLDGEGYLYLTDRVTNMIISGGVNIYPREIEDVLILHPDVADVAVVGIPDPDMGESVRAVVQLADGAAAGPDLDQQVIAFARERLSSFKCPRSVVVVDELPRLATGKLAKRLLPASALIP